MVDRRPFPSVVAALIAVLVLASPPRARAQEGEGAAKHADDPSAAEARRHYEEGTKAFNLGEFPRAITEFKAAYNAKADPSLLYNIAQSFRLQGDPGQAIFFYKSFLRNMPSTPNRKEVEGRIRALEKQVDEQKAAAAATPAPAAPAPVAAAPVVPPPPPAPSPAVAPAPVEPAPPTAATAPVVVAPAAPAVEKPLRTAPPPLEPAPPANPAGDLSVAPAEQPAPGKPIYKKWWFWTGIGAVVVGGVVAAAVAARDKPPSTSLGLFDPTFVKP